jgi:hypothetical protein
LSKGYDLDYIWKQVDPAQAVNAAGYYIQASETGGEPPGRWWGPGAKALGFDPGEVIERESYDLLFGERKAPDGTQLGRPPANGRKARHCPGLVRWVLRLRGEGWAVARPCLLARPGVCVPGRSGTRWSR